MCVGNAGGRLGLVSSDVHTASMTAGLVQEYDHLVLPSIRPVHTLIFTIAATVVSFNRFHYYGSVQWSR